jgi:hypothetical protein
MAEVSVSKTFGKALLEPLNHAMAAGSREALKQGILAETVIEMHLNHLASVVAMIEPPGAREAAIVDIVQSFAPMVRQHVTARHTTPGGIITSKPSDEPHRDAVVKQ